MKTNGKHGFPRINIYIAEEMPTETQFHSHTEQTNRKKENVRYCSYIRRVTSQKFESNRAKCRGEKKSEKYHIFR